MSIDVLLVTPVDSNSFRVFLSKEPRHFSPLAENDVLLRDNWTVSVTSGLAKIPVVESVESVLPREEFALGSWSLDLKLATRILASASYTVVASSSIKAFDGDSMASSPDDRGTAPGLALLRSRAPFRSPAIVPGIDLRYDSFEGRFVLDSRSDLDLHGGISTLKKRILRRLITSPGRFFHLADYGAALKVKEPFSTTKTNEIRRIVLDQVLSEDEISKAEVSVSSLASAVILVSIRARTIAGPGFELGFELDREGRIAVV